jgi:hypothetical protein
MSWGDLWGDGGAAKHKHQTGRNKQPRSSQRANQGLGGGKQKPSSSCPLDFGRVLVRLPGVMWRHRRELAEIYRTGATT